MYQGYQSGVVPVGVLARADCQLSSQKYLGDELTLDLTKDSRSEWTSTQILYNLYSFCSLMAAKDSISFLAFSTSTNLDSIISSNQEGIYPPRAKNTRAIAEMTNSNLALTFSSSWSISPPYSSAHSQRLKKAYIICLAEIDESSIRWSTSCEPY